MQTTYSLNYEALKKITVMREEENHAHSEAKVFFHFVFCHSVINCILEGTFVAFMCSFFLISCDE